MASIYEEVIENSFVYAILVLIKYLLTLIAKLRIA